MIEWISVKDRLPEKKQEVLVYIVCDEYEAQVALSYFHTMYKCFDVWCGDLDEAKFYKENNFVESNSSEDNLYNQKITHFAYINTPESEG